MMPTSANLSWENSILYLANEYMHPRDVAKAMKNNLNSQLRLQDKTIARNELNRLHRAGTNDVFHASRSILKQVRNDKGKVEENIVAYLMRLKISDANKELDKAKEIAAVNYKNLNSVTRPGTFARREYDNLVKVELKKNWKNKKEKMNKKVEFTRNKRNTRNKVDITHMY